mgnify:CR=1 FL=1
MTEDNPPPPLSPEDARRMIRRVVLPHIYIVALGAAAAVALVVYLNKGREGKETAGAPAACTVSLAAANRVAPLAKGQVAALSVRKAPGLADALSFRKPDGSPIRLADFRGRTVLLNLWATWCVPCRQEMPALDRLQAQAGSKDFEVVAVNIDTTRLDKPGAFLDEIGVRTLTRYSDPSADVFQVLKRSGKALGLPATVLIGPDGCEIGVMAGPAEWDSPDAMALVKAAVGG